MSNELQTTEMPTFLEEAKKSNRGAESEMEKKDQQIPRLSLVHATEGEIEAGTFVHSITKEVLSAAGGEVSFVPVFIYYEYYKWKEGDDDGLDFKTINKKDARIGPADLEWTNLDGKDISPKVETYIQCLALLEGTKDAVIITFKSTSYGFGKQLWNMVRMKKGDIFMNRFAVKADGPHEGKKKKKYYKQTIRSLGYVKEESDYKLAEQLYNQIVPGIKSGEKSGSDEEPSI